MKFGKTIQSQQVPGWGEYYLNYKALKKIINSYAAGRPASDASLLSLGLRPPKRAHPNASSSSPSNVTPDASSPTSSLDTPLVIPTTSITSPVRPADQPQGDLDPLPPGAEAPAPSRGSLMDRSSASQSRTESFRAHRDVFFFTLQRELEKINAFYLIKERDLRLRLLTLLTNRKRLVKSLGTPETGPSDGLKRSLEWATLEEGWRLFERDLGKLQGFIEINATGFRKILKKWDKRSKSDTKEMYLERQVEVQPCFNREFIAKLSDVVAANLLDLENGSDHLPTAIFADLPQINADEFDQSVERDPSGPHELNMDALLDLEANLVKALSTEGTGAFNDWLRIAKGRQAKGGGRRLMRILWRAALQVPDDQLDNVLAAFDLDFNHVDNINGRSPLHMACIAGSLRLVELCVEKNPSLLERPDSYKRRPLHYAALHGHPAIVSFLLPLVDPSPTDMDGYTPLMHAITKGHFEVVRILVEAKVSLEPTAISNDLIPLSLACQYGHLEVARLLLRCGAKVIPDSDGLFPQHFAAKAGHETICELLVQEGGPTGGGKDREDKYNLWTPLHHAAVGGEERHLRCIKVLVAAGCDVNATDEYGKSPGWYAAWFGHVECLNFLLASGAKLEGKQHTLSSLENLGLSADPQMDALSPGSDLDLDQGQGEDFELIPSLSLPPPIIPLRVYGHEFLAQRCQVQLSLGHPFRRTAEKRPPPIKLYSRSGQDSLHLWSSLKLVMASKSDITAVPHSVILPLADEREVFSFQVNDLSKFTLELSLYPTFGSKVIGRAVILPGTFLDIRYHKGFVAPLLDTQLKTIGEVAFEVSCIKPFEEARLEIGGRVETYWKSKVTPTSQGQDHAHPFQHRPLSVSGSDPSNYARPPIGSKPPATKESALVTASSLSGEYVDVVVQVTKDHIPVCYPDWALPIPGLDVGVADVTYAQFTNLATSTGRTFTPPTSTSAAEWYKVISGSLISLEDVLSAVPAELGLNVQLKYVRSTESAIYNVGKSDEVNAFVDPVLHSIYEAGRARSGRKIIFSSFDPTVCTALNWKQPNFAVFFASYCGISRSKSSDSQGLIRCQPSEEQDLRCTSVREAVNFAKSTNLLGVILEATTLAAVPSLVASVKDAGLLLASFGQPGNIASLRAGASDGRTVDALVIDGVMTLSV